MLLVKVYKLLNNQDISFYFIIIIISILILILEYVVYVYVLISRLIFNFIEINHIFPK